MTHNPEYIQFLQRVAKLLRYSQESKRVPMDGDYNKETNYILDYCKTQLAKGVEQKECVCPTCKLKCD